MQDSKNIIGIEKQIVENKAVKDIFEITYGYKRNEGFRINKTIFFNLLGKDPDNLSYRQIKKFLKKNIGGIEQRFLEEIQKIENKKQKLDSNDKMYNFLVKAYDYNSNMLKISLLGIPFELKKAGIKINLSIEEKKAILSKQEILERENGMQRISDNEEYKKICYKFLVDKVYENKDKLSNAELKKFDNYLKIIEDNIEDNTFTYSGKSVEKKSNSNVKNFVNDISNIKIPREDVIKLFELAFKLNGIDEKVIETDVDFIYDGPNGLEYPKKESFDFLYAHRVFALIDHEIEKHFFNNKIHKEILGDGNDIERGHGNLPKEEGLAIVCEQILLGTNIEDITIIPSFLQTYFGEILSGADFMDFLELFAKISPEKDIEGKYYRLKRGKDSELPGVQKKDSLYTIGLFLIIEFINQGKDIRDLFLGKISFDDIDNIKRIKGIETNIHLPVGVSEILMFKFLQEFYGKEEFKNFEEYIKEKYGDIDNAFFKKIEKEQLKIIGEMHKILGRHIKTEK